MYKITAIVLRAFAFSDSKLMVDVLSREEGRASCVVLVGSSKKGKSRRQLFQPMSLLELVVERKSVGSLLVVKDAHISKAFSSIPFDPYKLSISMFVAEFLCRVTMVGSESPLLYDYVCDSVQWLDGSSAGFSNFHLVFMMRLTRFVGVYPNMDGYLEGYCFDMQNGCFVSSASPGRGYLDAEDSRIMFLLMRMDYGNMHLFRMSHEERNRCLDVVLDFYRLHVPDFGELKSLQVLRDMFGTI
ncbi:DNA repair protein RecO C-terminal domain-containing protein [uncultured Prevotella sp.]|uniref:DNA repair protein RecO n=1 Tax=uncultured Prevotella sp. TaxID=159272 RepID=UPI00261EDF7D|nr:DNA repair protein RecO C-terminal domain-containing protein [uncultured Prevotella sp.]